MDDTQQRRKIKDKERQHRFRQKHKTYTADITKQVVELEKEVKRLRKENQKLMGENKELRGKIERGECIPEQAIPRGYSAPLSQYQQGKFDVKDGDGEEIEAENTGFWGEELGF
ncbi:MAG: hypothetical protein M1840_006977 [Geoglossum simile]|nr:MAG: hypothetical protein M1840_006977 [Geoglossum simile]